MSLYLGTTVRMSLHFGTNVRMSLHFGTNVRMSLHFGTNVRMSLHFGTNVRMSLHFGTTGFALHRERCEKKLLKWPATPVIASHTKFNVMQFYQKRTAIW